MPPDETHFVNAGLTAQEAFPLQILVKGMFADVVKRLDLVGQRAELGFPSVFWSVFRPHSVTLDRTK